MNSTSPTRRGSTNCASRGTLPRVKGEVLRASGWSSVVRRYNIASVKPVPTLPAQTKASPSQ
jgi:hypothetical protein